MIVDEERSEIRVQAAGRRVIY